MTSTPEQNDIDWALLGLYLSDHVSGATAGIARVSRMAKDYADSPYGGKLSLIANELYEERELLRDTMRRKELSIRPYRQVAAAVFEQLGRLKLNGRLLGTSPMTPLLEAEVMRSAVLGKIGGWQTLRTYSDALEISTEQVDALITIARRQIDDLSELHEWVRERAFRSAAS
ncbi:hypothetical protein [Cumulibacter manganitolerans]|uniref:hypothetical protein n=1 Tax=Cumulibacter manganitolerans TaxID=1884992 RepID=UPI0012948B4B|nr:hypothetical protein [Cumulibacter manganitolerans]